MEVLQCNIIQQMLAILDGLVPYSKDVEQTDMKSVAGSNEGEKHLISLSLRVEINSLKSCNFSLIGAVYPCVGAIDTRRRCQIHLILFSHCWKHIFQ